MNGILIKGGTVVDGSGAPAFVADVRVQGDRIARIAPDLSPEAGERVIDARGCHVTPGFIESHTHFDGTMWWQPEMDPLPGYGVTTTIMGTCCFSASPVHDDPKGRGEMVYIFSFFEDIPEKPFLNQLPWDWRSWSEYSRSMRANVKTAANYGAFVGHIAIRLAAMGMAAWERVATPEEIARMAAMLEDAMAAGAMGLSTNFLDHDGNDRPVPTLVADDAEFSALIDVLARYPGSSLQVVLDTFMRMTGPESTARLARLCAGKKVRVQWGGVPTLMFQKFMQGPMIELHEQFKKDGLDFWTGFAHTALTSVLSVNRSLIFAQSNDYVWHEVVLETTEDGKLALLRDPDWRARARESWDTKAWEHAPMRNPDRLLLENSDNNHGPVGITLADYARQLGVHHSDAMAEWLINNGIQSTVQMAPFDLDEEMIVRLIKDPYTVGNINDAPAHGQMLCGAGENLELITKYWREKGAITLEHAIHCLSGKLAAHFGLKDRGILREGLKADITVFHLDEIQTRKKKKVHDVPDGDGGFIWRWTRDPAPMRLTLVNGVPTFDNGAFTEQLPGEMLSPVA
ncbi:MAG: N-acyl-D-amino-acid deacylase family protein [Gammaproteobacteria bacterium]